MAAQRGHGLGIYEGLDDATAITVIQLQIGDIDEVVATAINTSEAQALLLQREELQRTQSVIIDRRISIQSVHTDRQNMTNNASIVTALIAIERQAEADHAMACRLAGLPTPPPRPEFIMPRPHWAVNTPPATPRAVIVPGPPSGLTSGLTSGQPNVATLPHTPISSTIQLPPNPTSNNVQSGAFNFRGDHQWIRSNETPLQQLKSFAPSSTFNASSLAPAKKNPSDNASSDNVSNKENRSSPVSQEPPTRKRAREEEEETDEAVVGPKRVDTGNAIGVDLTRKRARDEDDDPTPAPKRAKLITKITFAEYIARMKGNSVSNTTSNQRDDASQDKAQEQMIEAGATTTSSAAVVQTTIEADPTTQNTVLNSTTPVIISRKRSREEDNIGPAPPAKRVNTGCGNLVEKAINLTLTDPQHIVGSTATNKPPVTKMSECVSCMKSLAPFFLCVAECKHEYCGDCLRTVVQNALVDEAMFPPRCCKQPFPMDSMRPFLTPEIMSNYGEKKLEFETEDRTYCSNLSCSTFLYPGNILHSEGVCPNCFTVTCVLCKAPEHNGDCPKDIGIQEVMKLAAKEGWKRCEKCHRVVELKVGCNHITCKCKAEWCYVCGVKWKNCQCPQWDENRLVERVNQVVAHQPPAPNPAAHAAIVAAAHNIVVNRHHCNHDDWEKVRDDGPYTCEECGDVHRWFIFRCEQCELDACADCRFNVL